MNFEYFQIQKWMLQTVRAEIKDDKNGVICLVSMFPSWVAVLKLSEFSKKSKSIESIYIDASERSRYALSENGTAYYAMTYCFSDIRVWIQEIWLNFCWVSIFFYILIANISGAVAQTPINHIIFWISVMRTFRYIYGNYFKIRLFWDQHKIAKNALSWII